MDHEKGDGTSSTRTEEIQSLCDDRNSQTKTASYTPSRCSSCLHLILQILNAFSLFLQCSLVHPPHPPPHTFPDPAVPKPRLPTYVSVKDAPAPVPSPPFQRSSIHCFRGLVLALIVKLPLLECCLATVCLNAPVPATSCPLKLVSSSPPPPRTCPGPAALKP